MPRLRILILGLSLLSRGVLAQKDFTNALEPGPASVGFKTIRTITATGDSLLISLWYPADKADRAMTLREYILFGFLNPAMQDTAKLNYYKRILELPFLYHLPETSPAVYRRSINITYRAGRNSPTKKGRFPLVVAMAEPFNFPETFEFFASHGFVVAGVTYHYNDEQPDSLLYVKPTRILEALIGYMSRQPYIDSTRIAAFGFGGGIQPPFYLAMKNKCIKLLLNLDGAVFGPRSKTNLSIDYNPSRLRIPMLHITTRYTRNQDDSSQFFALSNPRYCVNILSDSVWHHDFTSWGRVADLGLHQRGTASPLIEKVYARIHDLMLDFLQHGKTDPHAMDTALFAFATY